MHSILKFEEDEDIDRVLFNDEIIQKRIKELGSEISNDFSGHSLAVIGVATGAFMFLADLMRCVSIPLKVDIIRAQSYGHGTESSGSVTLSGTLKIPIKGAHILIVEDILDTGRTLSALIKHFNSLGAASVSVCVLLNKKERREVPVVLSPDAKLYTGFDCPNEFVVGYGMDYQERYRSLPYIGVLKPKLYS